MRNKRKFNKTREWLIDEYVNKNRSRKEIAAECGLIEAGLKSLLKDWKISKEKTVKNVIYSKSTGTNTKKKNNRRT